MAAPIGSGGESSSELRDGIVWADNPRHINDINRSPATTLLAPVLGVKGTGSLQIGDRGPILSSCRPPR